MSKQDSATNQQMSPRTGEWCEQARVIVAYPEDFGMTRRDVRGLQRLLAAVEQRASARLVPPTARQAA